MNIWLSGKWNSKLPWREASPPNHLDGKEDSDQLVVDKELSLEAESITEEEGGGGGEHGQEKKSREEEGD